MKITTLIKHFLLIHYRINVQSRKSLSIRLIGVFYFLILYYLFVKELVLFFDKTFGTESIPMLLTLAYTAAGIIIFFLSFIPFISMFYYSSDLNFYFYLPIKKRNLILSKMIVLLLSHYVIVLFIYLPICWNLSVIYNLPFLFYLVSFITILIVPIIPASLSMIIAMVLMRLFRIGKRKFKYVKNAAILLSALLFSGVIFLFINESPKKQLVLRMLPEESLSASSVYPPSIVIEYVYKHLNTTEMILPLLFICVISYLMFEISIYVGIKIYEVNPSLQGTKSKHSIKERSISLKERSQVSSLLRQEFILLGRKPVLFIKGLISAILVPILCIGVFMFNQQLDGIVLFVEQNLTLAYVILVSFTVSTLGWNPIAISSFSRDKSELYLKSIFPFSGQKITFIKVLSSWLVFLPAILLYALMFRIFLNVSIDLLILWFVLAILISINGSIICTIFDVLFPSLRWTNEQQMFHSRTGITSFHVMNSILVAIVLLLGILMNKYITSNLYLVFMLYFFIFLFITFFSVHYLKRTSSCVFARLMNK